LLVVFVVLWVKLPSRLAVTATAIAGFGAPPLIDRDTFVGWDLPFVLVASIPVVLLMAATHFRINLCTKNKARIDARAL
jgi:hypothetical protein